MKPAIVLFIFLYGWHHSIAQQNSAGKKIIHAADIYFGIAGNKYSGFPCFGGGLKYQLIFGKNFIALGYNGMTEFSYSVLGDPIPPDEIDELSITFDRIFVARPVVIYAGAGISYTKSDIRKEHITGQSGDWAIRKVSHGMSIPFDLSVFFPHNGNLKIGLTFHLSYSKTVSYYSLGLAGHFEFRKNKRTSKKEK